MLIKDSQYLGYEETKTSDNKLRTDLSFISTIFLYSALYFIGSFGLHNILTTSKRY
jgi:hypothetical protein